MPNKRHHIKLEEGDLYNLISGKEVSLVGKGAEFYISLADIEWGRIYNLLLTENELIKEHYYWQYRVVTAKQDADLTAAHEFTEDTRREMKRRNLETPFLHISARGRSS